MLPEDEAEAGDASETSIGNLPTALTRLVGREAALSELRSLVWRTRLLTLCGPGGAGKTRLAVALAEAVRPDFVGGAWWADLSSTLDSGLVAQTVATEVHPGEPANDPAPAALARRFAESSLLVLDNCEQVVNGCAELVISLLGATQSLRVIAASRQPLGVPGEQVGVCRDCRSASLSPARSALAGWRIWLRRPTSCSSSERARPRARSIPRAPECARR